MTSLPQLLLKIGKATVPPGQGAGRMSIIIQRPYAYLQNDMLKTFEAPDDANIIVDRRYKERRVSHQSFEAERRFDDRRASKEELLEVVLAV